MALARAFLALALVAIGWAWAAFGLFWAGISHGHKGSLCPESSIGLTPIAIAMAIILLTRPSTGPCLNRLREKPVPCPTVGPTLT